MKFHHLAIGQSFELDGERYTKTAPLMANHATTGAPKFMARSTTVHIPGQRESAPHGAGPSDLATHVPLETALKAFDTFSAECLILLEKIAPSAERQRNIAVELEAIKNRACDQLRKGARHDGLS